jgi:ATP-dependent Zn protease
VGSAAKLYFVPRYRPRGPAHDAKARRDVLARVCLRQRIATRSAYPLGPVDDPFFPVALHEAGHCVGAFLEQSQIDSVKISKTERGGVSGRMRLHNTDTLNCAILMAGMAAEVVVLGYCEKECASTDLYHASRIASSSICSGDVDAFLDRQLRRITALLETHRDALLALTGEIINKRYLNGGEVNRIISEVLAGDH